jgi:hypothetical protein
MKLALMRLVNRALEIVLIASIAQDVKYVFLVTTSMKENVYHHNILIVLDMPDREH